MPKLKKKELIDHYLSLINNSAEAASLYAADIDSRNPLKNKKYDAEHIRFACGNIFESLLELRKILNIYQLTNRL